MHQGIEILIAEDSPTQAAQLQYILERHDYCVSVAGNGQQALDMLRKGESRPALIISDITMPEINGYELCGEIKADERLKDIPVMLLTSLCDPQDIVRGLECGADNFLTKPYEEKLLLSRVQYILLNREIRRGERTQMGMEIVFSGQRLVVTPERQQILDLLISSYETAVQKNLELQLVQEELRALNESLEEKVEERTAELRQSEEKYRELIENANDIIYTHDLSGRFTSLNRAGERITGYTREEALQLNFADVIASDNVELVRQMIVEKLKGGELTAYELEITAKDGSKLTLEINSRLIFQNGEVVGVQGIGRDITERKHAAETLRQTEEQLRQSQKLEAIGLLAGGIAHDFNNLLTVIGGYSSLLLRSLDEAPERQQVEEIKKASDRAAALTRQLLAFSRKQVLQPVVLNLNDIVPEIDKMLRRLIGADIDLLTVIDPELWQVKADAGQIEQVLMNLAVNARDAMPSGGRLTIQTANVYLDNNYARQHIAIEPGSYVMLAVSDTGCGMDAETRAHIFEPFFTTKEAGKGTGLGLSTVYGIIKQSGGHLWVYSEVGKGTTFKVYLPQICEATSQRKDGAARAATPGGTETVLLVEDEDMVRQLVRDVLESNGYRVLLAASGSEALHISERYRKAIHLLMTDVVMPEMGGREIVECLMQSRFGMKVLYMSGYTDESIVHHGVLDEGVAFLEKPFTPEAVARKVREVLDSTSAPDQNIESLSASFGNVAQTVEV